MGRTGDTDATLVRHKPEPSLDLDVMPPRIDDDGREKPRNQHEHKCTDAAHDHELDESSAQADESS